MAQVPSVIVVAGRAFELTTMRPVPSTGGATATVRIVVKEKR